ncbi:unnamed protein product [Orchesella dallaii]|uniref:Uncharacterized protein n=1 Tax=Orchesella dallaii TaxID=48710 RepID=A0ABP1SB81_9HEXA
MAGVAGNLFMTVTLKNGRQFLTLEDFYFYWEILCAKLIRKPGCLHAVKDYPCSSNCMYKWGTREVVIICGYTSLFLCKLPPYLHWKLQMAKVLYQENGVDKKCISIPVDPKKQDEVVAFIKKNFKVYVDDDEQ